MSTAYANRFHAHGGLEELRYEEVEMPSPGPGEVLLEVRAATLNHLDLFVRRGWPGLKLDLPHAGGTDVAGRVMDLGEGVPEAWRDKDAMVNPGLNFLEDEDGEQVIPTEPSIIGETRSGGFQTHIVVPAEALLPLPDGLNHQEAACLPLTIQTAMQMIRRAGIPGATPAGLPEAPATKRAEKEGRPVRALVVGAGGGVSVMLTQLLHAMDVETTVIAGGPEKVALAKDLGASHVIDYKQDPNWSKAAYLVTGKAGYDAVFDSNGQATIAQSLRALAPGGRLLVCGTTTGAMGEVHLQLLFWKQLQIIGSTMGTKEDLQRGLAYVEKGQVKPRIDSVYPLSKLQEAQQRMEEGRMCGKIVVVPDAIHSPGEAAPAGSNQ